MQPLGYWREQMCRADFVLARSRQMTDGRMNVKNECFFHALGVNTRGNLFLERIEQSARLRLVADDLTSRIVVNYYTGPTR